MDAVETTAPALKRRKAKFSPTKRSNDECKKRGWPSQTVEQTIGRTFIKRDLFGFGDIVAMDGQPGSLLIQATSTPNAATRVNKIIDECAQAARQWLRAGNRIVVWGWAKRGAEGKRKLWTLKEYPVTLDMLSEEASE